MKTHLSHTFRSAMAALLGSGPRSEPAGPTPDHVMLRLENVFEALGELSFQPHVAAALDLACDALQAELPTAAVAAGLYDIDSDEIRIVAARGEETDLLRGVAMPRARCLVGYASQEPTITRGDADGAEWLANRGEGSTVLLYPILHDAHLLGVLGLADPLCTAEFEDHDLELVGYVAERLASFIQAHRHAVSEHPVGSAVGS